ncbi:hypothetical protein Cni_G00169 [Canna indica]|uniref:Uncharacterized protein n=1 Tax=Canna indica TaxID=4628 RepID=A0AAQ3PWR8_9LILI|nr:hypothetical protein Cni_G00169 [Canna indica]
MMRFQRLSSPDVLLGNGRRPSLKTSKEYDAEDGGRFPNYSSPLEAKSSKVKPVSGSDYPSPNYDRHFFNLSSSDSPPAAHSDTRSFSSPANASASPGPAKAQSHHQINGASQGGGGDVLFQWGQKKRSRGPRTEARASVTAATGDGSESSAHARPAVKLQRRSSAAAAAAAMPPPGGSHARTAKLRPGTPGRDSTASLLLNNRGVEERSEGRARSEKRSPRRPPEKSQKTTANASPHGGVAADGSMIPEPKQPSDPEAGVTKERLNLDHFEWPRIYISLSRKEKEDDFLAMKGTKLPQRPKKRAKNIDRTLQYCFPGMWLSDLTRGRYEVREKKCVKKVFFSFLCFLPIILFYLIE